MANQNPAWLKPGVFAGALTPLGVLLARWLGGRLQANPVAEILNQLGMLALVLLLLALACTPLRLLSGWNWPLRLRRMLGLFAFFYALLHFLTYIFLDQGADFWVILADIANRKFIMAGAAAFLLLLVLARTSTQAAVRRMGTRNWQRLHRLAYVAGILAVLHFAWRVKLDLTEPLIYGAILGLLLLIRILFAMRKTV